ncbi:5-aminolevulinate synthase, partial [Phyllobacterium brassicacearum]
SNELVIELKDALVEVWTALGIPFSKDSAPAVETSERVVTLAVSKAGG